VDEASNAGATPARDIAFDARQGRMGESTLFLVRIWATQADGVGSPFRASVRAVHSEQVELFTAADALARFLLDAGGAPPARHDGGTRQDGPGDER
jgi:hypothetical protein